MRETSCLSHLKMKSMMTRRQSIKVNVKDLGNLPKAVPFNNKNEDRATEDKVTKTNCDSCKTLESAVVYCVDCGKKFCSRHKESHGDLFGEAHKMVPIAKYNDQPNGFAKAVCKHHPTNYIAHACKLCFKMPCSYCTPGPCDKLGTEHQFQRLEQTRSDIQAEIDEMLAENSKKVAELCNLEKQTWLAADELAEKCEAMLKQVDTTMKQKIEEIQTQAAKLKEQILKYQADQLQAMEGYIANLMSKVETLEAAQMLASRFLKENGTTEIIEHRSETIDELGQANKLDSATQHQTKEMILISKGYFQDLEVGIVSIPKYVIRNTVCERHVELPRGHQCRSIIFGGSGELISACSKQILIGDGGNEFIWDGPKEMILPKAIYSVSQPSECFPGVLFAVTEDACVFAVTSAVTDHILTVVADLKQSLNQPKICASHRFIVVSQSPNKLICIDMQTRLQSDFHLANVSSIRSICFDADGDLIVLDATNNRLNKYRIKELNILKLIWSCALPTGAYAACVDRSGQRRELVFVTGAQKSLTIVENGHIVQTLTIATLPDHDLSTGEFSDISVYWNTLATTQNNSKFISIFKLEF